MLCKYLHVLFAEIFAVFQEEMVIVNKEWIHNKNIMVYFCRSYMLIEMAKLNQKEI